MEDTRQLTSFSQHLYQSEIAVMEKKKSYWITWYIAVFAFLVLQVIIFYFITRQFL